MEIAERHSVPLASLPGSSVASYCKFLVTMFFIKSNVRILKVHRHNMRSLPHAHMADDKKDPGFGGSFDLGDKPAKGMGDNKNADAGKKKVGFGGTVTDMGAKDAVGVGEGK